MTIVFFRNTKSLAKCISISVDKVHSTSEVVTHLYAFVLFFIFDIFIFHVRKQCLPIRPITHYYNKSNLNLKSKSIFGLTIAEAVSFSILVNMYVIEDDSYYVR